MNRASQETEVPFKDHLLQVINLGLALLLALVHDKTSYNSAVRIHRMICLWLERDNELLCVIGKQSLVLRKSKVLGYRLNFQKAKAIHSGSCLSLNSMWGTVTLYLSNVIHCVRHQEILKNEFHVFSALKKSFLSINGELWQFWEWRKYPLSILLLQTSENWK